MMKEHLRTQICCLRAPSAVSAQLRQHRLFYFRSLSFSGYQIRPLANTHGCLSLSKQHRWSKRASLLVFWTKTGSPLMLYLLSPLSLRMVLLSEQDEAAPEVSHTTTIRSRR